jgi:hypothetical protein
MTAKELSQLVTQIETHIECWKQFNHFVDVARSKKFGVPDENNFLELKSVIVQELELIYSSIEITSPGKEEIHALIGNAPSLRFLAEMSEGSLRGVESQWHKIYIGWHSILGQLKVKLQSEQSKAFFQWKKK